MQKPCAKELFACKNGGLWDSLPLGQLNKAEIFSVEDHHLLKLSWLHFHNTSNGSLAKDNFSKFVDCIFFLGVKWSLFNSFTFSQQFRQLLSSFCYAIVKNLYVEWKQPVAGVKLPTQWHKPSLMISTKKELPQAIL